MKTPTLASGRFHKDYHSVNNPFPHLYYSIFWTGGQSMKRMPESYELGSSDPRSPYFDDGYRRNLQPRFVKELNPNHLRSREPLRNPQRRYKNPNPYQELRDFQRYIWEGK